MYDIDRAFDYENGFYLTCSAQRISKFISHYELFKLSLELPGDILEFGVFKGASLSRLALMREIFGLPSSKAIIGFDVFGKFPDTEFDADQAVRQRFIDNAGENSIPREALESSLQQRGVYNNIELVKGDITETLPVWLEKNPQRRFSFVNLDTDIFEPAVCILENVWSRIVKGGILLLDDYAVFPGETSAVDAFFADKDVVIKRFAHAKSPSYIVK